MASIGPALVWVGISIVCACALLVLVYLVAAVATVGALRGKQRFSTDGDHNNGRTKRETT
jgi:hypothetical protein